MYYSFAFKDSNGFWTLGPVFEDRDIPARIVEVMLSNGQLGKEDVTTLAKWDIADMEESVNKLNKAAGW